MELDFIFSLITALTLTFAVLNNESGNIQFDDLRWRNPTNNSIASELVGGGGNVTM